MAEGAVTADKNPLANTITVKNDNNLIHYHGRWDSSPGTWWAGSGFKLHASGLKSLTLNLGSHTTTPYAAVGLSVNYGPFQTVNVSAGANVLPIATNSTIGKTASTVIRVNVEGWQNNRINLESLSINKEAKLLPYNPAKTNIQFIGDSLTAGQYDKQGIVDSWGFVAAETLKAEYNINAQPGGCLTDQLCWGNVRGVSHQFFQTEDTGYFYTTDHNYTTPWDFSKEKVKTTHVVIEIGANDNAYKISNDAFTATYVSFVDRLRSIYPTQPIFIVTPWGWPSADGSLSYYYQGCYEDVIAKRQAVGDKNIFLIDATGWIGYEDVFPDNVHPNEQGHRKIAEKFVQALKTWGLDGASSWATSV